MRRFLIWTGLALAFCIACPLMADSTAAPAATVISMVGHPKVSMDAGKTYQNLNLGDTVAVGAMIETGEGKLSLLLSDGSTARLAQDTEMTLKEQDPEQASGGTIFAMAKGFARFLVNKVKPGNHFEVHTPNAVAAVKGTDFEAGVNGDGTSQVWVFKHDGEGKVELADLKHLLKMLIIEEHYASFNGNGFTHGTFTPGSVKNPFNGLDEPKNPPVGGSSKPNGGAPNPNPNVGNGGTSTPPADVQALAGDLQNSFAQIAAAIKTQIHQQQAADQLGIGQIQLTDQITQRMVFDQNGNQVLVTQDVSRPSPSTVINTTVNNRAAGAVGGEGGITTVQETTVFNAPIPFDWVSTLRAPVNPTLYRVDQNFTATDPQADLFSVTTAYQPPQLQTQIIEGGSLYLQPLSQTFLAKSGNGESLPLTMNLTLNPNGVGDYIETSTTGNYLADEGGQEDGDGGPGTIFTYADSDSEQTMFAEDLVALSSGGAPYNIWTNGNNVGTPSSYWATSWPSSVAINPSGTDVSLHGALPSVVPASYDVEMILSSPSADFMGDIDVVFLPGFFDTYDISIFQNDDSENIDPPPSPP